MHVIHSINKLSPINDFYRKPMTISQEQIITVIWLDESNIIRLTCSILILKKERGAISKSKSNLPTKPPRVHSFISLNIFYIKSLIKKGVNKIKNRKKLKMVQLPHHSGIAPSRGLLAAPFNSRCRSPNDPKRLRWNGYSSSRPGNDPPSLFLIGLFSQASSGPKWGGEQTKRSFSLWPVSSPSFSDSSEDRSTAGLRPAKNRRLRSLLRVTPRLKAKQVELDFLEVESLGGLGVVAAVAQWRAKSLNLCCTEPIFLLCLCLLSRCPLFLLFLRSAARKRPSSCVLNNKNLRFF